MSLRGSFIPHNNVALFLDVDGTLLEIAATPAAVRVPAALRNTLQLAFRREDGALALISGRTLTELDVLFDPHLYPAAGQHGLEIRNSNGDVTHPHVDRKLLELLGQAAGNLDGFISANPKAPEVPDALLKLGTCQMRQAALIAVPQERAPILQAARGTFQKLAQQFPKACGNLVRVG